MNDEPCIQRAAYKYPDLVSEEKEGEISERRSSHKPSPSAVEHKPKALQIEMLTACVGRRHSGFSIPLGMEEMAALKHTNLSSEC